VRRISPPDQVHPEGLVLLRRRLGDHDGQSKRADGAGDAGEDVVEMPSKDRGLDQRVIGDEVDVAHPLARRQVEQHLENELGEKGAVLAA
jgi:hypothetical protein